MAERTSRTCTKMLTRICATQDLDNPALTTYRKFMTEIIAEWDIGAQETCHMLQKLPLIDCSRPFTSLNVVRKVLHQITRATTIHDSYIHNYMKRPTELEALTLLKSVRSFIYSSKCKDNQWRRRPIQAIVCVYPHFSAF